MKRIITLIITILFFVVAALLGLKNQQLVNINYLLAQSEMRLATLLAIIFLIGVITSGIIAVLFSLKLKIKNRQLLKMNKKQSKELNELRALPVKD
ncbi:MAG: putative membrane protein [Psychromonas sp.]|jgi:putative membrane protein|uniref:LapA family protein n=1 Tax=Psychromonas sp. TaxID=1884585 RepID=UPI0039E44864